MIDITHRGLDRRPARQRVPRIYCTIRLRRSAMRRRERCHPAMPVGFGEARAAAQPVPSPRRSGAAFPASWHRAFARSGPPASRASWLGATERLDPALPVHRQHDRVRRHETSSLTPFKAVTTMPILLRIPHCRTAARRKKSSHGLVRPDQSPRARPRIGLSDFNCLGFIGGSENGEDHGLA